MNTNPIYSTPHSLHPLHIETISPLNAQDDALGGGLILRPGVAAAFPVTVCRSASAYSIPSTQRNASHAGCVPQAGTLRLGTSTMVDSTFWSSVCAGVEPESEPEPARQATIQTTTTLENGSGTRERGEDSSPTPCEETIARPTCCTPSRSHVLRRHCPSRTRHSFAHLLARPYLRGRPRRSLSR